MVKHCFFFNDTATTEIYTLSLHDALPIWRWPGGVRPARGCRCGCGRRRGPDRWSGSAPWRRCRRSRSEEHTSELQSRQYLVCRLLLEKKKKTSTEVCTSIKTSTWKPSGTT